MFIAPRPTAPAVSTPVSVPAFSISSDSLDSILALGQEEARDAEITAEEVPVSDSFDFLTDLIAESTKEKKQKERLSDARKLLKNTTIQGKRRENLEAEVTRLALQQEWVKTAYSLWIRRCTCEMCEQVFDQFSGVFERQRSRHSQVDRWVAIDMPDDEDQSLPRECRVEEMDIAVCNDCLLSVGVVGGWNVPELSPEVEELPSAMPSAVGQEEEEEDYGLEVPDSVGTNWKEPQELEVQE